MAHHAPNDGIVHAVQAPRHPVSQLQGPFEESMLEAVHEDEEADNFPDPITRRNLLLEAPTYTRIIAGRWKKKPGELFHPLWKLIAQISFGIHLLAEQMARSEDEVMQILQAHVDEIDGLLERTTEDFDLAQEDIQERLRCLKLPLSHPTTFDKMLEDRNFRLSIVEGNEKIEHIVERTTRAMKDSMKDVQKGFESISCLEMYLQDLSISWHRQSMEHEAVFVAMLGNVEGWRKAFTSLHTQGSKLAVSLKKLTDIINEMQARAGEVSRRLLHQARVQHPQVMGRPVARGTPMSRLPAVPDKRLPTMPDRPPLRQTVSHEAVRISSRTSSQEALRQQALLRSQTPQHDMPAPRSVKTGVSPRIIQMRSDSQARVQSMVPSLMEAAPSAIQPTLLLTKEPIQEEEQQRPEKQFPPVELPAHVPEETMRAAPMSKQNRLSSGLDFPQANQVEKRNSKLGTSALLDLLRTDPITTRSSETLKSTTPEASRRASTTLSNGVADDTSPPGKLKTSTISSPRSASISDTTSQRPKNNIRRPKRGVQHWFDALDDDLFEDETSSIQDPASPQMGRTNAPRPSNPADHENAPGTPSWAVTGFDQTEKRKEILKNGAFNSHPPDLPLGSPPLAGSSSPHSIVIALPQRRLSHASTTGLSTLGEPGPEVAASEVGSTQAYTERFTLRNADAAKRASAMAPEVVVEKARPASPVKRVFIAEMEGSSPMLPSHLPSSRDVVMELEAPQQYFKLPPRPTTNKPMALAADEQNSIQEKALEAKEEEQKTGEKSTSLGPARVASESLVEVEETPDRDQHAETDSPAPKVQSKQEESAVQELVKGKASATLSTLAASTMPIEDTLVETKENAKPMPVQIQEPPKISDVVEQYAEVPNEAEILPSKAYVATPSIPLPPSPFEDDESVSTPIQKTPPPPAKEEQLYILPALAYKAPPISPRLPPSPTIARCEPDTPPSVASGTPVTQIAKTQIQHPPRTSSVVQPPRLSSDNATKTEAEEYDPYKADDIRPESSVLANPEAPMTTRSVTNKTLHRDRRPAQLKHTRNSSSHGSQNGWKAFFTGQPSPVGSNLSIRSVKRESIIEPQQIRSPVLLSPTSVSSRHHFPSPSVGESTKDQVETNRTLDESTGSSETSRKTAVNSPEPVGASRGLGITTEGTEGSQSAASTIS